MQELGKIESHISTLKKVVNYTKIRDRLKLINDQLENLISNIVEDENLKRDIYAKIPISKYKKYNKFGELIEYIAETMYENQEIDNKEYFIPYDYNNRYDAYDIEKVDDFLILKLKHINWNILQVKIKYDILLEEFTLCSYTWFSIIWDPISEYDDISIPCTYEEIKELCHNTLFNEPRKINEKFSFIERSD